MSWFGFEVNTQQLLLTTDDAQLDGRVQRRIPVQLGIDTVCFQQRLDAGSCFIFSHDGQQSRSSAHGDDVARYVRRTTQTLLGSAYLHHGNRRLGRYALDLAEPVTV